MRLTTSRHRGLRSAIVVTLLLAADAAGAGQSGAAPTGPAKGLPPAVAAAFKRAYPAATIKHVSKEKENGRVEYEIESLDGQQRRDLVYLGDGTLVSYEEPIAVSAVPAAVVSAVRARYPRATIGDSEKVFEGGSVNYELELKNAGAKEVMLTADGMWISPRQ